MTNFRIDLYITDVDRHILHPQIKKLRVFKWTSLFTIENKPTHILVQLTIPSHLRLVSLLHNVAPCSTVSLSLSRSHKVMFLEGMIHWLYVHSTFYNSCFFVSLVWFAEDVLISVISPPTALSKIGVAVKIPTWFLFYLPRDFFSIVLYFYQ